MQHRKDIEGLRCFAVLPIVLLHAGLDRIGGGFLGVDVFFVISGFLITRIILDARDRDAFSLVDFYRRRLVRIAPALLVLLICTLAAGIVATEIVLLLPDELGALAQSAAASSLFGANIFFWLSADYFAPSAETLPLLHLWSLGVEEQFYLFYPLILVAMHRYAPKRLRALLLLAIVLSLLISAVLAAIEPTAGFYLLPSRAWELGMGGFAATFAPREKAGIARNGLAIVGLSLIVMPFLVTSAGASTPYPGAIRPCLGTAIVLACGPAGLVGALLSLPPFRFIGRMSYSLYLWHWPLITFYRLATGRDLTLPETLGLTAASLIAAMASYHLVERPFLRRFRDADRPRLKVLAAGGVGLAAVAAAAALLTIPAVTERMGTMDPAARKLAGYVGYAYGADVQYQFRRGPCYRWPSTSAKLDLGDCTKLAPNKRNVLVFGDSHAAQYWRAISLRYPQWNVMQATAAGCRPLLGGRGARSCRAVVDHVLGPLTEAKGIDTVILAARWQESELPLVPETLREIGRSGAEIVVLGPAVEYDQPLPSLLAKGMIRRDPDFASRHRIVAADRLDREMRQVVTEAGARYVSERDIICAKSCKVIAPDGGPMNFDSGHLTMSGSQWVVDRMPTF